MKNTFALKYWSEKILLKRSGGTLERLSSLLAKSTIDHNPHQVQAAIFSFNSPLSRGCILADEVGLGKTIEAGLVISQLSIEGKKKILIIAPASLRTQWQQELNTHFGLETMILDSKTHDKIVAGTGVSPLLDEKMFIASLQFAYRHRELIEKQAWDLIIVDEAHRLRSVYREKDSKIAYALRNTLRNKPKLLLTATPLQNNLLELYGLVSFIDDKILGNQYYFQSRFIKNLTKDPSIKNEVLTQLRTLLVGDQEDGSSGIITRTLRKQVKEYVKFTTRHSFTYDFIPSDEEQLLYEKVSSYLQRKDTAAIATSQRSLMVLIYRKLLASSSYAIAPTLKKLYERLQKELDSRKAHSTELSLQTELFDEELDEEMIDDYQQDSANHKAKNTLDEYSDEHIAKEIIELTGYYKLAISIKDNTKAQKLLKVVEELLREANNKSWPQKIVIFTESTRTQQHLFDLLKLEGIGAVIFNGNNKGPETARAYQKWSHDFPLLASELSKDIAIRQSLVYEFQTNPEKRVFLTTEAGSEGLNLQFANILINFDLPWNPQRIEQRIGRVHRYGQQYEVIIANLLNTANHADKRVLELLRDKLGIFDGMFGSSDEILGNLEDGIDFEQKILEIYQTCLDPEDIDSAFKKWQVSMSKAIDATMHKIRENMLDNFDDSIMELFRQTKVNIAKTLTEYDQSILELLKYYYGKELTVDQKDSGYITIQGSDYLVREEQEKEKGVISRLHTSHPLIQSVLTDTHALATNPIPVINITPNTGKAWERLVDVREGYIVVYKLVIKAVDTEEILVPLAFTHSRNEYIPLDSELSQTLAQASSTVSGETVLKSPLTSSQLLTVWNEWKEPVLKKYEKRNQNLYIRETDRIYRYWDNYSIQTKDALAKTKLEIADLRRHRDSTLDFQEKRKIDQKIQSRDLTTQKLLIKQNEEEQLAIVGKEKDLAELNVKLNMRQSEELIAIAKFRIVE